MKDKDSLTYDQDDSFGFLDKIYWKGAPPANVVGENIQCVKEDGQEIAFIHYCEEFGRWLYEYMLDIKAIKEYKTNDGDIDTAKQYKVFDTWRSRDCKFIRKVQGVTSFGGDTLNLASRDKNWKELKDEFGYDSSKFILDWCKPLMKKRVKQLLKKGDENEGKKLKKEMDKKYPDSE